MTEENDDSQTAERHTQFLLKAIDGESIESSSRISLEVLGDRDVVLAIAEIAIAFLKEGLGAEIQRAYDANGNDVPLGPLVIDPLSAGDDPVAE
jgi:hypothetical protein